MTLFAILIGALHGKAPDLAQTPPRGWSSWYPYGAAVDQEKLLAVLAALNKRREGGGTLTQLGYANVYVTGWESEARKFCVASWGDAVQKKTFWPPLRNLQHNYCAMPGAAWSNVNI
jgi:hypothetical protein